LDKIARNAVFGCLLTLSASVAYSGSMGPESVSHDSIYLGVFGGGGAITSTDISQYGTAFYTEAAGGPLAVNGFGTSSSSSTGMVGGHVGFAWPNTMSLYWPITSAVELEGYYLGSMTITGHDLSNDTIRLDEHDFLVSYPLKTGVFLVNAVLNANNAVFGMFRPYVGVGIGSAIISISGATATQLSPAEPGINHYNGNANDNAFAFAAQPKVGIHYDFNPHVSLFAEYRFLYLSQTNYTFGSTVAAGHVATAPWAVSIKPQYYNMGTVGIDLDI
jgi:hypothetical protein